MSIYALGYKPWPAGLFDIRSHILIGPDKDIPPQLVVEHELTHIKIHRHSHLGTVEEALQFVDALASRARSLQAVTRVNDAKKRLQTHEGTLVHETAAWFLTETLLKSGRYPEARLTTPQPYRVEVAKLFVKLAHLCSSEGAFPFAAADVVEAAAALALGSSTLENAIASAACLDDLTTAVVLEELRSSYARFESIIDQAARLGPDEAVSFAAEALKSTRPQMSENDAAEVSPRRERNLHYALVADLGLWDAADTTSAEESLEVDWALFQTFDRFDLETDRYAQVAIFGAQPNSLSQDPPVPAMGRLLDGKLLVNLWASAGHPHETGARGVAPGYVGAAVRDYTSRKSNFTALNAADNEPQRVLSDARTIVVAESADYDFSIGDYRRTRERPSPVVADLPHVVMATTSFRDIWTRIVFAGGIRSDPKIEFNTSPLVGLGTEYALLLLKASGAYSPIILLTVVAEFVDRTVSFAAKFDSIGAHAPLRLSRSHVPVRRWAGRLASNVAAVTSVLEDWWYFEGREIPSFDAAIGTMLGWQGKALPKSKGQGD